VIEREILNAPRIDDLPGAYVPRFYETYRETGNVGPLVYIVDHNRKDLLGLVDIFGRLGDEW
jgi:hypothetical protein